MKTNSQNHPIFVKDPALFAQFLEITQHFQQLADKINLNFADYEIDHIALRANSQEKADEWFALLSEYGHCFSSNEINGRPIHLFELSVPFTLFNQKVVIVELPYPKGNFYKKEGWEHIEITVPLLYNEKYVNWCKRIENRFMLSQTDLSVKYSEPKSERESLKNVVISLKLKNNDENYACIKFHPYTIKEIVMSQ